MTYDLRPKTSDLRPMGLRDPARPLSPGLMAHMSVSNPLSPVLMAQMGPLSLLSLGLGFYVFEILRF